MKRPQFSAPGPTAATITVPDQDDSQVREIDYVRWAMQLQADLAQSLGGVMLRGARPVPLGTAANSSSRPTSSPGRLVGWSVRETSGAAAATVRLFDGRDTSGTLLATLQLTSGQSHQNWLGGSGVSITDALYVDITGQIEGSVYLGAVD